METGKTTKYFKYAIGEIILVVIGILIALQINNWNEFRKERKLEQKLLTEVMTSIKKDTSSLNYERKQFERIIHHGKLIRSKIDNDELYEKSLDSSFAIINTFLIQQADYKSFERIESVGIEIITNDVLKNLLVYYYDQSKFLFSFENDRIGDIFMRKVYPKYFKRYSYGRYAVPKDFEALKSESEFLIHLDYCINDANYYKNNSISRKKAATRLLNILKNELNK